MNGCFINIVLRNYLLLLVLACFRTMEAGEYWYSLPDEELGRLLIRSGPAEQLQMLAVMAARYRHPNDLLIRSKSPAQDAYPLSMPVNGALLSAVVQLAQSSTNINVSLASIEVLNKILIRTNVSKQVEACLSDNRVPVRLRASGVLITYSAENTNYPILSVIDALKKSLVDTNHPSDLITALNCVAQLGSQARSCVVEVSHLRRHRDPIVRKLARKVIAILKKEGGGLLE